MGKSHQRGSVVLRGKKWYGYFRKTVNDPVTNGRKTSRITVILGPRSEMSKGEAREALQREIAKEIGELGPNKVMNDGSVAFDWFVRNRFFPLKEASWNPQTAKHTKYLIDHHLVDHFGKTPLVNFDKFSLQLFLNRLALTQARNTVLGMRIYLRAIFAEAVDQEFLTRDPARKLKVPRQLRDSDKTTLTWSQLQSILPILPERDRLLLELGMTNALRPGELFAFRWKCFNPEASTMNIIETTREGTIRPWAKTKKSLAPIHLPSNLVNDLEAWRARCPDSSPDAFIFPNACGGFLNTANYVRRVLRPLAESLGLPKLTFQVIRRTIATLAQTMGTVKDIQGLLRHSRAATTTDVYMQMIPERVQETIDSINRELKKSATAPSSTPELEQGISPPRDTAQALAITSTIRRSPDYDAQTGATSLKESNDSRSIGDLRKCPGSETEGTLLDVSPKTECLRGDLPLQLSLFGGTDSKTYPKVEPTASPHIGREDPNSRLRQYHYARQTGADDFGTTENVPRLVVGSPGSRSRYSREELYEKTWKVPMRILAKEYGVSDVALAKTCRALRVPLPGRGYWAKKIANKPVALQPPLPVGTSGDSALVRRTVL